MSGTGLPILKLDITKTKDLKLGVVASSWHDEIMSALKDGAARATKDAGIEADFYTAPGSLELPVIAKALTEKGYDAIVVLGVVIRGGTPHFDYVCDGVTYGLMKISVETGIPIGNGVLTCDTEEQAIDRSGVEGANEDKGYEATVAALYSATTIKHL
ncbi:MAG: 6,7-dimethyl-8-ribityllumazine synthase [Micrococcaceae bacterium]